MLSKVKKLYEQARVRVVSLRAVEISEHREKIDTLTNEVEANELRLQTMPGLVEDITTFQTYVSKHGKSTP